MGGDPQISVLNQFCQAHDTKNLFVMDASCFVSIGGQNPLTMMALAVRSTDYLMQEMRRGVSEKSPNAQCTMHNAQCTMQHDAPRLTAMHDAQFRMPVACGAGTSVPAEAHKH